MSVSKNLIKYIHSLSTKKVRTKEGAFVVEGFKSVGDLLRAGFEPLVIVATQEWFDTVGASVLASLDGVDVFLANGEELRRTSLLQHPQQVIAVFRLPSPEWLPMDALSLSETLRKDVVLCLDGIQDPGNLGTIIRTADWFGVRHIVCSPTTADAYAPKVVQATMGSIGRVRLTYTELPKFLSQLDSGTVVLGTFLDGESLSASPLPSVANGAVVVMGNEGNGISCEVGSAVTRRILIPSFPADRASVPESLNVSTATAIILADLRLHG